MKVSFIIPAYNVGTTIERAIESAINQKNTKIDYEIIVVNDGSTDNIDEIISKYENRIKYYKKENGGLSDARNYGVEKAKGEYIIFVDGDDYISTSLLSDIEEFINQDFDLIKWSPIIVDNNGKQLKEKSVNNPNNTTGEEAFNLLYGTDPLLVCAWNYAIKKDRVIEFPKGMYHEDFATTPLVLLKSKTVAITDKCEYFYVQTDSSIMRGNDEKKQRKRIEDMLAHFDNLINTTNNMKISKRTKENVGIFATNAMLVIVSDLKGDNKDYYIKELKKRKISKYIKIRNVKQLIKKVFIHVRFN